MTDAKHALHQYLHEGHDALLWKLEGLDERDLRRPMTPTGTNLLGLVKHTASTTVGYLGDVFDRPFGEAVPWFDDAADDNADMFATAEETVEDLLAFDARCWQHADATVAALDLDAPGRVPWWPGERGHVSLHQVLVHVIAELHRHAGHADLVRELIDGSAGLRDGTDNLPPDVDWPDYVARLERIADAPR
jgi:hypothetical protein